MATFPPEKPPPPLTKSRVMALLGLFLFGGFFLATTVSYLVSRNTIRQTILRDELPLSSDNIYSEIQRDLFEPILISSLMANDTFLKDWIQEGESDPSAVIRYLKQIQTKYRTITSFLVSENTRNYYHADKILKVVRKDNPADAWFFRVREMEQDYEINVDPDMANRDTMTIFINYRVLGKHGEFLGATGVGLTVNAVKNLMQEYRERYQRDIFFYDLEGNLVLHSQLDDAQGEKPENLHQSDSALRQIIEEVQAGAKKADRSAVRRNGAMANYRYIPELEWILVVEQRSDRTQAILWQSIGFNFLICLLTSAGLVGVIRVTLLGYHRHLETRNQQLLEKNREIARQAEELGEANRELDALHREKDEFIGITVHDLKNPLTSVQGFAELLDQSSTVTPADREYIHYIASASHTMLEHVEELLKLTELQTPRELPMKTVDLAECAKTALREYDFHARAKFQQFVTQWPEAPVKIKANEKWLVSVIGNLVSNAVKYSPSHSKITIQITAARDETLLTITDEGDGIPAGELPLLFGKFARLSSRPTAGESSSGLGLYLVRQMVERMGGQAGCESIQGNGAKFWIRFPGLTHSSSSSAS